MSFDDRWIKIDVNIPPKDPVCLQLWPSMPCLLWIVTNHAIFYFSHNQFHRVWFQTLTICETNWTGVLSILIIHTNEQIQSSPRKPCLFSIKHNQDWSRSRRPCSLSACLLRPCLISFPPNWALFKLIVSVQASNTNHFHWMQFNLC